MLKIDFVLGTRPEITKCAALLLALTKNLDLSIEIAITGQQTATVEGSLVDLGIEKICAIHWLSGPRDVHYIPDWQAQAAEALTARWTESPRDAVIVQGDTFSSRLGAEVATRSRLVVCHLEAGIRHDGDPVEPEEINRRIISKASSLHFAPSDEERATLIAEGIKPEDVVVIGDLNLGAIALTESLLTREALVTTSANLALESINNGPHVVSDLLNKKYILCTFHRPASLDNQLELARQLQQLAVAVSPLIIVLCQKPDSRWIPFFQSFQSVDNVLQLEFQPPTRFHLLEKHCQMVITDSAGVQQEALLLGKRVLVARNQVELYKTHPRLWLVPPPYMDLIPTCLRILSSQSNELTITPEMNIEGERIAKMLVTTLYSHLGI
jgi:UDP-N-acetylglucosamine 2-epimerase (non-hydrolysing)